LALYPAKHALYLRRHSHPIVTERIHRVPDHQALARRLLPVGVAPLDRADAMETRMEKPRKKLTLRKLSISKLTPEAVGAIVGGPPSQTDCQGGTVGCSYTCPGACFNTMTCTQPTAPPNDTDTCWNCTRPVTK